MGTQAVHAVPQFQKAMSQTPDFSNYPLPADLTGRVVTYLNVFRLFISVAIPTAYVVDLLIVGSLLDNGVIVGTMLASYFVLAVYFAIEAQRSDAQHFYLAQLSLLIDILLVSIFLFTFGGLDTGLGALLIFASASAAFLLPLQTALFLASLAVLTFISEALLGVLLQSRANSTLIQAGLYGITTFITTLLASLLSFWIRDYRLIAEQQAVELIQLEQINELVIRRMRGGVMAIDERSQIQMMNESSGFLIGSPSAQGVLLADVSPELERAMTAWRDNPSIEIGPVTLQASQTEVVPKFVALPGSSSTRVLIFLEDNDVVAQRARELSARSLAKLSGGIAHEIRNPLSAITHAAQLLGESDNILETDTRLVDIIDNQSRRMNGIVESILQLSRREKSRPDIFDLPTWLNNIVEEFSTAMPSMDIDLIIETENEQKEVMVLFDPPQLHQIIWKLMDNAMRHAGHDSQVPEVKIIMLRQQSTGYCFITVEDNGPGIDPEQIEHIFEPFYTTHRQGAGLGLYIARQLCEANLAELTVDSTPGTGTRFHIRLALASSDRGRQYMGTGE